MSGADGSTTRLPVTLYDYGVGNLHSIKKALERSGARVTVTKDPDELLRAEAIVLPGVGAFGASMRTLDRVRDELRERLAGGTHCLAVCIGMQLLFESSQESPGATGIGLLRGAIRTLPPTVGKIPHLGWNTLRKPGDHEWKPDGPHDWRRLLPQDGTYAYFVHSFYADVQQDIVLACTRYGEGDGGVQIPAVVARGNTLATQFHPEKSSTPGLRFIARWVQAVQRATPGTQNAPGDRDRPGKAKAREKARSRDPKRPEGKH